MRIFKGHPHESAADGLDALSELIPSEVCSYTFLRKLLLVGSYGLEAA